jgi:hypothetical protein
VPNRSFVFLVAIAGLLAIGGAIFYFSSSTPAPIESPAPRTAASPSPPARVATPSPTPEVRSTPRPAEPAVKPTPTPEPSPTTATLIIQSDVPDTSVFVDRVFLGAAPVTAKDLKPGPHRINMTATGYEGFVDTIELEAGTRTFAYAFKEIKLDASIAVTHKHGIGSCTGTLRATPKGLTYETTNKDDGFSAALTDLETFSVDYLEKNLKVKAKGGKSYTFVDTGGDVNRLYLFHRDVDKARQRLISGK